MPLIFTDAEIGMIHTALSAYAFVLASDAYQAGAAGESTTATAQAKYADRYLELAKLISEYRTVGAA